jgi:hypothetical protein
VTSYYDATTEELTEILKGYMEPKLWKLNDFENIIANATVDEEYNDVWFKLSSCDLALDLDTLEYNDVSNINGFNGGGDV